MDEPNLTQPSEVADGAALATKLLPSNWFQDDWTHGLALVVEGLVLRAAVGLLALLAAYFAAKLISGRVASLLSRRLDETVGRFLAKLSFYALMILAGTIILPMFGIQVSGVMAVLATAGFAVGLAFQGTLSNFSAGILLLVFRPFKVGDMVNVAGVTGKVNEIDIFTTTLDTPDNRRLFLSNGSITGSTIENLSYHPHRRVEVLVGVEYGASLDRTRAALTQCVELMSPWIIYGEGRGYQILLSNLGPHAVEWTVRIWVAKENFFLAKEKLTGQIKSCLDQQQIAIPFPQLTLHMATDERRQAGARATETAAALAVPSPHSATGSGGGRVRPRARGEAD